MKPNQNTISDLKLERYLLEELPENEMLEVKQLIKNNFMLEERVAKMKTQNKSILLDVNPAQMAQQIQSQTDKSLSHSAKILSVNFFTKTGSIAAVLCLIALLPMMMEESIVEETRIKGESYLSLFKKTTQEPVRLSEKDTLQSGDLIQIRLHPRGMKHGAIFSIDGNGAYTQHQLKEDNPGTLIERAGPQLLPFSYELDDAPHFEQFFFISSPQKFNLDQVLKSIKEQCPQKQVCTSFKLDSTFNHYNMTLIKAER